MITLWRRTKTHMLLFEHAIIKPLKFMTKYVSQTLEYNLCRSHESSKIYYVLYIPARI